MVQLRVKNIGPSAAYDIQLKWKNRPENHAGEKITALDEIPFLLPDESASILVGVSFEVVKRFSGRRFEGEVRFKDANGKPLRQNFVCSTQGHQKQLVHDEELPKTLRELQDIPQKLETIANKLSEMHRDRQSKLLNKTNSK